jgi:hypothetical protein
VGRWVPGASGEATICAEALIDARIATTLMPVVIAQPPLDAEELLLGVRLAPLPALRALSWTTMRMPRAALKTMR